MSWSLSFERLHCYDAGKQGITLPVRLQSGALSVDVEAKFDPGAGVCVFERIWGEKLGLDIESGDQIWIGTATGSFPVRGHFVTMSVVGYDFEAVVYFAEDHFINRNVLGRHGLLDRFQVGLIDYEGKLFLSRYGENSSGI